MARSQRNSGWNSHRDPFDTIDLTLSSPEPEPQRRHPRPQHHLSSRQSQLPNYIKSEPQASTMSRVKNEPGVPIRRPAAPQQTRPIDPEHLRDIIRTTNSFALEEVLISLCKKSPAFSGALVRGVAHHSSSAQGMIKQYQQYHAPTRNSMAGPASDEDSDNAYELAKKKLASNIRRGPQSYATPPPPRGAQSVPRIKSETLPQPHPHDDLLRPGPYPRTAPRPTAMRSPLQHILSSSSAANRGPQSIPLTQRFASISKTSAPASKMCIQCKEPYKDDDEVCMWHPGSKVREVDGSVVWDCCHDPLSTAGCDFGAHVSAKETNEGTSSQRKRPSPSPASGPSQQKRPRVF